MSRWKATVEPKDGSQAVWVVDASDYDHLKAQLDEARELLEVCFGTINDIAVYERVEDWLARNGE